MKDSEQKIVDRAAKMLDLKVGFRKARDLDFGGKAILFFGTIFTILVFCFDASWIDKFHVSATVVIATVACTLQYYSYQEKKSKGREKEIIKFCGKIVNIIHSDRITNHGDFTLNLFGESGRVVESSTGRHVRIQGDYLFVESAKKGVLSISVTVLRGKEGEKHDDYFHHIKYITTPVVRFLMSYRCHGGKKIDSNGPIAAIPVDASDYSDLEWREMIGTLSYIMGNLAIDGVRRFVQDHFTSSSETQHD